MTRRPGFTLLEMLVAMTLLAFIMVAGQQAIALAARAAAPHGDGGHSFLVRHQIADWLETSLPVRSSRRERSPLVFLGEQASIRFVTDLPERFGMAGPHIVTLAQAPGGLLATWQPLRPGGDAPVGERLLLDGVSPGRIPVLGWLGRARLARHMARRSAPAGDGPDEFQRRRRTRVAAYPRRIA